MPRHYREIGLQEYSNAVRPLAALRAQRLQNALTMLVRQLHDRQHEDPEPAEPRAQVVKGREVRVVLDQHVVQQVVVLLPDQPLNHLGLLLDLVPYYTPLSGLSRYLFQSDY